MAHRIARRLKSVSGSVAGLTACLLFMGIFIGMPCAAEQAHDFSQVPAKGMVTLIDLGAKKCIPCKMMAPILEKMEKAYRDKAAIVFIDVWENREQAGRFGIRSIPTQIFFDRDAKEVYRHVGFLSEAAIVAQLQKMGVK
jgi:thioredoxin 1